MSAHFSVERLYPSTPFVYRYPFGNPVVVARSVFYLKKIRSPSAAIKSKLKSTFLTLSVPKILREKKVMSKNMMGWESQRGRRSEPGDGKAGKLYTFVRRWNPPKIRRFAICS